MSATALAVCPFCQHQAIAPALLKGARTQCPNCFNFYKFLPVEPTAEYSASDTIADALPLRPRIARRRVMQIKCPNCDCELKLTRTRYRHLSKHDLAKLKRKLRKARAKKLVKRRAEAAALADPAVAAVAESTEFTLAANPETAVSACQSAAGFRTTRSG